MPKVNDLELQTYFAELRCGKEMENRFRDIIADHQRMTGSEPEFLFVEDEINDDGKP